MPSAERPTLEAYVASGKLAQVTTLCPDGRPILCHVWYDYSFKPDRLRFMSQTRRDHCQNIRNDDRVAGGIVAIELSGLGQKVRGVTFKGIASELSTPTHQSEVEQFIRRWPAAAPSLVPDSSARLYEIQVSEWLLFDEEKFPEDPRRILPGE